MAVLEAAFRTRGAQTALLEYCLQASMFDQTFLPLHSKTKSGFASYLARVAYRLLGAGTS